MGGKRGEERRGEEEKVSSNYKWEKREEEEGRGEEEKVGERKEGQEGREDLLFLVKWCSRIV
jgi:hypothetical protein